MKIDKQPVDGKKPTEFIRRFCLFFEKTWLRCLSLALVGFLARLPALQGQLIWDDQYLAHDNPLIKSPLFVFEVFRHYLFLDSYSPHYRPVQNISLMLDYFLWNTDTFGFHLTNVLLHVTAGILLYFLLRRLLDSLSKKPGRADFSLLAFLIAGIWMVHPVHSAAIDYISGRADSLCFLFACAAWLLFFRAAGTAGRSGRIALYFASATSCLIALCSRETACVWLALFLLHLFVYGKASGRIKGLVTIACLTLLAVYVGLRQMPSQHIAAPPGTGQNIPLRGVLMLRALGDYTRLLLFPSNLHMERTVFEAAALQNPETRARLVELEYLSVLGTVALALFVWLSLRRGRGQAIRLLGAGWFLVAFLPISNLVDLNATAAEHWLYLPSVGFFVFLFGCGLDLPKQFRRVSLVLAVVAVLGLGARSFVRSGDWIDPETFFQRTAAAGGVSCRIGVNLGHALTKHGKYEEAEKIYRNVLKMQPDYTMARSNLADALTHLGKEEEAKKVWADATEAAHTSRKEYPRTWIAALNYAHVLSREYDSAGTLAVLEKARVDYPDTWELIAAESEQYRNEQNFTAAISLVRPFAEKNWWHYDAWMALGRVLAEKADVDLAEAALRHASLLDIHSTDALNLIAVMRMGQNRLDEAFRAQRGAVARQPDQPRQYVLLSNILEKMGRNVEAQAALAEVSRLRDLVAANKAAN